MPVFRFPILAVAWTQQPQERIFEPFFTTKFTGRGLGMPVTLGLIRSYGGAIAVDSQLGGGATFRLIFPTSEQEGLPSRQEESPAPMKLQGAGSVLVVDDDPMIRILAQAQLEKLGYEVIEALRRCRGSGHIPGQKDTIGLVLLDLAMPRMDGWETLTALRALRPDIPVVISAVTMRRGQCKVSTWSDLRPFYISPTPWQI